MTTKSYIREDIDAIATELASVVIKLKKANDKATTLESFVVQGFIEIAVQLKYKIEYFQNCLD